MTVATDFRGVYRGFEAPFSQDIGFTLTESSRGMLLIILRSCPLQFNILDYNKQYAFDRIRHPIGTKKTCRE